MALSRDRLPRELAAAYNKLPPLERIQLLLKRVGLPESYIERINDPAPDDPISYYAGDPVSQTRIMLYDYAANEWSNGIASAAMETKGIKCEDQQAWQRHRINTAASQLYLDFLI
jgi:hypothetical protein